MSLYCDYISFTIMSNEMAVKADQSQDLPLTSWQVSRVGSVSLKADS